MFPQKKSKLGGGGGGGCTIQGPVSQQTEADEKSCHAQNF